MTGGTKPTSKNVLLTMTRSGVALAAAAALAISGCSSISTPQTTQVKYYPQCYQPVRNLRDADENFKNSMMINTAIGAAGGAAAGAIFGGDLKSAALGALGGGILAAAGTYAANKLKEQPNDELRRQAIAHDMAHDNTELQKGVLAARAADSCYSKEFDRLVADVKAKRISNDLARDRYHEIEQGTTEVAGILGEYNKKARRTTDEYRIAYDQETGRGGATSGSGSSTPLPRASNRQTAGQRDVAQKYAGVSKTADQLDDAERALARDNELRAASIRGLGINA
jgi:hypothetical protein